MPTMQWSEPSAWADAFTAASLTGGTVVVNYGLLSSVIVDNSTTHAYYADLSVRLASFTPTAGGNLAFYALPLLDDGTTYADGASSATASSQPSMTHFIGALGLRAVASAQNGMLSRVLVPPTSFKFYVLNKSGAALATTTTGNTIKYRLFSEEAV